MTRSEGSWRRRPTSTGWTVRRLLAAVLAATVAGMLLVGAIGAFAVHESTETVDALSDQLSPAQVSNAEFMEAMLDSGASLRAYLISGGASQLADYRVAVARVPKVAAELRRYAERHPDLAALAQRQEQLARDWQRDFATPAIAAGPRRADDDFALFDVGVRRFDAVKDVNGEISEQLAARVSATKSESEERLNDTVALIAVIGIVGALLCGLLGWWVLRSIRGPLADIEDVVDRLAAGDLGARVVTTGPTEVRRVAQALNDMAGETARSRAMEQSIQERLLEADRVKSEFVANVSHELRTPLTSIDGYLELLSEDLMDTVDQEHAEMMTVMQRNVARLRGLIEDLLDLGRIERQPEVLQPVDLAGVVRNVAEDLRLSAGSRDITISVDVDPVPAVVRADATQLQRALTNLVANAVKFSHEGGDIRVHLGGSEQEVEVTVADNGIGIPGVDQLKVGERFFRASNAVDAHIPGTGLGLRMVQAIVTNHEGYFGLASQEGQGTTATVRLPVQRESTGQVGNAYGDEPDGQPEGQSHGEPGREQSVPLPR